jgi:protein O-mannosyl-transferase
MAEKLSELLAGLAGRDARYAEKSHGVAWGSMKKRQAKRIGGPRATHDGATHANQHVVAVGLVAACLTFLALSRILFNDFVDYDDNLYVTGNPQVQEGLTLSGVYYAFTDTSTGNWHPLTMLAHMLNYTLFGLAPMGHHLSGLLIHSANTLLLCLILYRMTRTLWPSAAAALLFGIHPLHVASVAHVAQLKDLLSTFFWLLTMWAYAHYAATGSRRAYRAALAFFALGLLAKSMLVTLPVVLLILDYWPLRRFTSPRDPGETLARRGLRLAREKIPFFALAAAVSMVTFIAQRATGAVLALEYRPLSLRIQNAAISYVTYLVKTVWPTNLAVFYPYPETIPAWRFVGAAVALLALTALAWALWKRRPYLLAGWMWYLVTLIPVIGIVQVGAQAMADRYSYVPLIGIFVAVAWAAHEVLMAAPRWRVPVVAAATVAMAALAVTSWVQAGTWQNSRVLWQHAIDVTTGNHLAYNNLGVVLVHEGELERAERSFQEALRLLPEFRDAQLNLANIYTVYALRYRDAGRYDDALTHFNKAVAFQPPNSEIYMALGRTHFEVQNYPQAVEAYAEAVRLEPGRADARLSLGIALERAGDYNAAERQITEALRLQPDLDAARTALARVRRKAASP